jgi:hypothetical protein
LVDTFLYCRKTKFMKLETRRILIVRNATEGPFIWQPYINLCVAQGMQVLATSRISKKLGDADSAAAAVLLIEGSTSQEKLLRGRIELQVRKGDYIIVRFNHLLSCCFLWENTVPGFRNEDCKSIPDRVA